MLEFQYRLQNKIGYFNSEALEVVPAVIMRFETILRCTIYPVKSPLVGNQDFRQSVFQPVVSQTFSLSTVIEYFQGSCAAATALFDGDLIGTNKKN